MEKKMKSLGVVRKVDELGRIVLPIETRRLMDLSAGDGVHLTVDGDKIILKKYVPACIFCGGEEDVVVYKDKKICKKCISELNEI